MSAKISAICFIHKATERLTLEFKVKEITAVSRLNANQSLYPSNQTRIGFDTGNVVFLKGSLLLALDGTLYVYFLLKHFELHFSFFS